MIHVQTWTGSGSIRITDMTLAHKRGKRCRTIHCSGWMPDSWEEPHKTYRDTTLGLLRWAESIDRAASFDDVAAELRRQVTAAALPDHVVTISEEDIRAIDAPRPVLTAGVPGKWSASADESGVIIDEDADQNNMPCMITPHDQTKARAYELAAKVWDKVKLAATFSEAGDILGAAGCKLHYYCRMD
jgi:hypothetical protein